MISIRVLRLICVRADYEALLTMRLVCRTCRDIVARMLELAIPNPPAFSTVFALGGASSTNHFPHFLLKPPHVISLPHVREVIPLFAGSYLLASTRSSVYLLRYDRHLDERTTLVSWNSCGTIAHLEADRFASATENMAMLLVTDAGDAEVWVWDWAEHILTLTTHRRVTPGALAASIAGNYGCLEYHDGFLVWDWRTNLAVFIEYGPFEIFRFAITPDIFVLISVQNGFRHEVYLVSAEDCMEELGKDELVRVPSIFLELPFVRSPTVLNIHTAERSICNSIFPVMNPLDSSRVCVWIYTSAPPPAGEHSHTYHSEIPAKLHRIQVIYSPDDISARLADEYTAPSLVCYQSISFEGNGVVYCPEQSCSFTGTIPRARDVMLGETRLGAVPISLMPKGMADLSPYGNLALWRVNKKEWAMLSLAK